MVRKVLTMSIIRARKESGMGILMSDYQVAAKRTRAYPEYGQGTIGTIAYNALGLSGEAGEVANKVKKLIRDGDTELKRLAIKDELGDCLWYLAMLADELKYNLTEIAEENLEKLAKRKLQGNVKGDGDDR